MFDNSEYKQRLGINNEGNSCIPSLQFTYTRYFKITTQKQLVKTLGLLEGLCVFHPNYITHRGFSPLETTKGTESASFKTILCSPQPNKVYWQGKKANCHSIYATKITFPCLEDGLNNRLSMEMQK